jgi:hypothetical protein
MLFICVRRCYVDSSSTIHGCGPLSLEQRNQPHERLRAAGDGTWRTWRVLASGLRRTQPRFGEYELGGVDLSFAVNVQRLLHRCLGNRLYYIEIRRGIPITSTFQNLGGSSQYPLLLQLHAALD